MYKIIGADGKEYGPVSVEQIRQWLREGRANGQTKVVADGATEWKALSELPEFAAALGARVTPPAQPPVVGAVDADALAREILARDYRLEIGSCFSRSWALVMQHFWLIVGASFVLSLIEGAVGLLAGVCVGGFYFFPAVVPGGAGCGSAVLAGIPVLHPAGNLPGRGLGVRLPAGD
jgi:hypothetical protein